MSLPLFRAPAWSRRLAGCALLLLSLCALPAWAVTTNFGIAFDSDNNAATGCTVATANGPVAGIDQVFTAVVTTSTSGASVTRLERQSCVGGALSSPATYDAGGWPVGIGAGAAGMAVIELSIPLNFLPPATTMKGVVTSATAAGTDATPAFSLTVTSAAIGAVTPVPLSPWLLLPLALGLLGVTAWARHRYPGQTGMLVLLVLVSVSSLAWAATVIRDGATGDWAGISPVITDPAGDAPPNADLVAVFYQQDATNLYVRIDADVRRDATNQAPVVSAGTNQAITLPSQANLAGTASDDGLPNPPGALTLQWSKVTGPGTVSFFNAAVASTTAGFSSAGTYVLRLTANDGALATTSDVTITVNGSGGGGANQAPAVNAGPNQSVTLPAAAALSGSATDDGLPNPPGALTYSWSQVSGPGTASFANPNAAVTSATFGAAGSYVLRLTASDSQLSGSGDVTVTVGAGGGSNAPPTVDAGATQTVIMPGAVTLHGTATDDGQPGPLNLQWTRVSGPGTVSFGTANAATTTATFSQPGTYVLRLTANDGQLAGFGDVIVTAAQTAGSAAAPVAKDDSYTVHVGQKLTVNAAQGVLANDVAPGSQSLTALKLTDPNKGTLSLFNADGSFTFQAPAAFSPIGIDPTVLWRTPVSFAGFAGFIDVNGDGTPDIITSNFGRKEAFDGRSGAQLWVEDVSDTRFVNINGCAVWNSTTFSNGDIDGSGKLLLFTAINCDDTRTLGFSDRYYAVNLSNVVGGKVAPYWVSERFTRPHPDARLHQGDPAPANPPVAPFFAATSNSESTLAKLVPGGRTKLLTRSLIGRGVAVYNGPNSATLDAGCRAVTALPADEGVPCRATFILDAATGVIEQVLAAPNASSEYDVATRFPWRDNAPIVADLDGDGQVEIISGSDVWKLVNDTWTLAWQTRFEPNIVAVADLDGDGKAEIVQWQSSTGSGRDCCSGLDNGIFIYKHDGTLLRRIPQVPTAFNHGFLTIADVDGDGQPDLLFAGGGYLYAYRPDGRLIWVYAVPDIPTAVGPFIPAPVDFSSRTGVAQVLVHDLDLDGKPEVILNVAARLIVLDGRTGLEKWSIDHEGGTNGQRSTVLADFDGDGHIDIGVIGPTRWNCSGFAGGPVPCLGNAMVLKGQDHWAPGGRIRHQMQFRPDAVTDAGVILYDGSIRRDWAQHKQLGTVADTRQRTGATFTYTASTGSAQSAPATAAITILPPNSPPVITSVPPTGYHAIAPYTRGTYQVTAFDPDGDAIRYEITATTHFLGIGNGVRIDPVTGLMDMYVGPCGGGGCDLGNVIVIVAAIDAQGARTEQGFMVNVTPKGATVPDVVGQARAAAFTAIDAAGLTPRVLTEVPNAAPVGTVLAQAPLGGATAAAAAAVDLTVSKGPQPVAVPYVIGLPLPVAQAQLRGAGLSQRVGTVFSTTVPASQVMDQNPAFGTLVVPSPDNPVALTVSAGPPLTGTIAQVIVEPGPSLARIPGDVVPFRATAVFTDKTAADVTFAAAWTSSAGNVATVDGSGSAKALAAGATTIAATIAGVTGQASLNVAAPSGDSTPPTAAITVPADGANLTGPTTVTGTATDANFLRYEVAVSVAGQANWIVIGQGTTPVSNGSLATFDATAIANDLYDIRLQVFDRGGNVATAALGVQLSGQRKPGLFTLAFQDLNLPISSIPVTVTRTYDSRDKAQRDFGIGWRLGLDTLKLRTNRVPGTGWVRRVSGPTVTLLPTAEHKVSLMFPDGRIEEFDLQVSPTSNIGSLDGTRVTGYRARPGTRGQLAALGNLDLLIVAGGNQDELVDDGTLEPFDPKLYRYTAQDGTQIEFHKTEGVRKLIDRNGNTITFGAGGIVASNGAGITFDRDATGRITKVTDPKGNVQSYAYDANGDLASHTNATGNTTRFRYDRNHGLIDIVDPTGNHAVRNEYDDSGFLIATIDAAGHRTTFTHNPGANQDIITDRLGNTSQILYDDRGNVLTKAQPVTIEGRLVTATTTMTYDADDNPTAVVDADGRRTASTWSNRLPTTTVVDPGGLALSTSFTYSGTSDPTSASDPAGRAYTFTYDARGNIVAAATPDNGGSTSVPDAGGLPAQVRDSAGTTTTTTRDAAGNPTREDVVDAGGRLLRRIETTYDVNGNTSSMTLYRTIDGSLTALTTTYGYDSENRLVSRTDPAGGVWRREYDAIGRLTATIDALGRRTTTTYDALGRPTVTTRPDGTTETLAYDDLGNVVAETDAAGRTTRHAYDELNRKVATTRPGGGVERTVYTAGGKAAAQIDARGNRTDYAYDAAGRLVTVTQPAVPDGPGGPPVRPVMQFEPNALGAPAAIVDPLGRRTTIGYDGNGRRVQMSFADGSTARWTWDSLGRRTQSINEEGQATTYAYDGLGRLVSVSGLAGDATYAYDEAGNLLTQTDALGRVTRFRYDRLNRPIEKQYPGGGIERMTWDAAGNLLTSTDTSGRTTTYSYDTMDRIARRTLPDSSSVSYTYAADGQRATVVDARGTTTYSYDGEGRVASVTQPSGARIDYGRDAVGNLTTLASPAASIAYAYDALNRMQSVTAPEGTAQVAYDRAGNRVRRVGANGGVTDVQFDARNRAALVAHKSAGNLPLASFATTYSPAGRRTQVVDIDGAAATFAYDAKGRLASESRTGTGAYSASYIYDAVGNRTQVTHDGNPRALAYDGDDRLLSDGSTTFAYDGNGNVTSRTVGGVTTQYRYDTEDRLVQVTGGGVNASYGYDADGRRVSVTDASGTTQLLQSEITPTGLPQVLEERDGSGNLKARYSYADRLLAQVRGGVAGVALTDGRGNVRALSDATGAISDRYAYDANGSVVAATGSTVNPYRYGGERLDAATGLYDLRARQYDPAQGRFLTRDGFGGRLQLPMSAHRYLYASGDPVNAGDPTGFETLTDLTLTQAIEGMLDIAEFTTVVQEACQAKGMIDQVSNALVMSQVIVAMGGLATSAMVIYQQAVDKVGSASVGFDSPEFPAPGLKKFSLHAQASGGNFGFTGGFEFHNNPVSLKGQMLLLPPPGRITGLFALKQEVTLKEFKYCGTIKMGKITAKIEETIGGGLDLKKGGFGALGVAGSIDASLFRGSVKLSWPLFTFASREGARSGQVSWSILGLINGTIEGPN